MEIWLLELQDIKLEIFYFKDFQKLPDYRKNNSTDLPTLWVKHFALEVRNIEKTLLYLQEKWVEIITEIKTGRNPVKYFFFKDPNGILVEIIQDI